MKEKKLREMYTGIKKIFEDVANKLEGDIVTQIKYQFDNNECHCYFFNTALTGKKSRTRFPLNFEACQKYENTIREAAHRTINASFDGRIGYTYALNVNHLPKEMGKFSSRDGQKDKYAPQELRLFEKIKKQLGNGQVVTVGFTKPISVGGAPPQSVHTVEKQSEDTLERFEPIKGKNGERLFKDKEGKYGEMTKEELKKWAEIDFEQRKKERRYNSRPRL